MDNSLKDMPLIDLTDRTDLQTVADREEGQYLGHVTTALLSDGTVLAVYPKCHAVGQILLKKSTDGGKNWSARQPVPESWARSLECPTIYRMTDAAGKERLWLFSGGYPGQRSVSEDNGQTWSEFESMDFGGIVFLSTMVCTGPGKYLALFHDEGMFIRGGHETRWQVYSAGEGNDRKCSVSFLVSPDHGVTWPEESRRLWGIQPERKPGEEWKLIYETDCGHSYPDKHYELYQIETEDGGLTWSEPRVIVNHETARLCEPCLIPSPDGRQLIVLMRENTRRMNSMMIMSADGGRTWSEPREVSDALTGDRHTAKYLPDGRLFVTFRDMAADSETKGDWVAWIGTFENILRGESGQYRIRLKENPDSTDCAYPGLEILPDGTVLTVTYGHWEKGHTPYILAVRLRTEETDALYREAVKAKK